MAPYLFWEWLQIILLAISLFIDDFLTSFLHILNFIVDCAT